jgi:hypothetical protein
VGIVAYPKSYRRLAYEFWRNDRSQTATDVARLLNESLRLELAEEIPVDTVMDWKNRDGWEQQYGQEMLGASPQMLERIVSGVAVGALSAVKYLTDVTDGAISNAELADPRLQANRIQAARALIQTEIALIAAAQPKGPKTRERNLVLTPNMTDAELLALEAKTRSSLS